MHLMFNNKNPWFLVKVSGIITNTLKKAYISIRVQFCVDIGSPQDDRCAGEEQTQIEEIYNI